MGAENPILLVNIPPLRFVGDTTNQGRTSNMNVTWDKELQILVATAAGVPVEEAL